MESLEQLVNKWLLLDQNDQTRSEVRSLWQEGNTKELERRMRTRIEFGTAGLRGRMEAGWSRMNDLIVIQASQGLCHYVLEHVSDAAGRGVVVGHDHRHHSRRWAELTSLAFLSEGVKVYFQGLVHTPIVPFSVKKLSAACGVMITASHNPKQDNGYKVYWENGVQIISPHDEGISKSILENLEPRSWAAESIHSSPLCISNNEQMKSAYFERLLALSTSSLNGQSDVVFVNTSMHGVGGPYILQAFKTFGFNDSALIPVKKQENPDPDFPTVAFPNPEEKGALDLALHTADQLGVEYVLAQDPDADRFSAAEKSNGEWVIFTGDQLGAVFAARCLENFKRYGKELSQLAMVASTVSSKMVEKMAAIEGFRFEECLTGFKFIGNVALKLEASGYEVPFGYEEAIGYMFGSHLRDKDGVAATMMFAEMVADLRAKGRTVNQKLLELYSQYGYFKTNNGYFICRDPQIIDTIFQRIRNYNMAGLKQAESYPGSIAGLKIASIVDLTVGFDSRNPPTFEPSLPLSSGHMIQFRAGREDGLGIVLTIRTSGTEPKIKYYLEGSGSFADKEVLASLLESVVRELGCVWFEADKHNLVRSV